MPESFTTLTPARSILTETLTSIQDNFVTQETEFKKITVQQFWCSVYVHSIP